MAISHINTKDSSLRAEEFLQKKEIPICIGAQMHWDKTLLEDIHMGFFEEKGDCGCNNHGGGFGNNIWVLFLLMTCCGGCGGCGGRGHDGMGCVDVCELFFIIFLLGICGRGCHKGC